MCELWERKVGEDSPLGEIPAEIDAAHRKWGQRDETISRIKLYNASNFFDPRAVPDADYASMAGQLGDLDQVIVESHPSLIGDRTDRFRAALSTAELQVAMGLETVHPEALEALNKRM